MSIPPKHFTAFWYRTRRKFLPLTADDWAIRTKVPRAKAGYALGEMVSNHDAAASVKLGVPIYTLTRAGEMEASSLIFAETVPRENVA